MSGWRVVTLLVEPSTRRTTSKRQATRGRQLMKRGSCIAVAVLDDEYVYVPLNGQADGYALTRPRLSPSG